MDQNKLVTLPLFSGRERVVGPWFPDLSRQGPEERERTWVLIGRSTSHKAVQVIPICVWPFRIGRDHEADLSLPSPTVSRVHAELSRCGGRLQIRDLSSRNGTFVDGCRIQGSLIIGADALLQFAAVPFRVCLIGEADRGLTCENNRSLPSACAVALCGT